MDPSEFNKLSKPEMVAELKKLTPKVKRSGNKPELESRYKTWWTDHGQVAVSLGAPYPYHRANSP
jgi:hypothetical protein